MGIQLKDYFYPVKQVQDSRYIYIYLYTVYIKTHSNKLKALKALFYLLYSTQLDRLDHD